MIKYDLIGKRFGKLVVIWNMPSENQQKMWKCLCDCGGIKITSTKMLNSGQCVTCGCSKYTRSRKHGMANSKPYQVWFQMKKRTTNPKSKDYYLYGGRGIKMQKDWNNFENFWRDMGKTYQGGLMLDRINNEKGYYKNNCRWTDSYTQANNTRRNVYIEYNGEKHTESEWNRKLGFNQGVIGKRIRRNWSIKKALTTPI